MYLSKTWTVLFLALVVGISISACGYSGVNDADSLTKNNPSSQQTTQTVKTASQALKDALQETLFDEYKARATYDKVLATFGSVRPFSNIVKAEVKHANAILALYQKYGLQAPKDPWTANKIASFQSVKKACEGGVQAEIDNAAIYDRLLKLDLPQDVKEVFTNLRNASEDNHLQAFRRCASQ